MDSTAIMGSTVTALVVAGHRPSGSEPVVPSAGGRVRLSAGPLAALHPYAEGVSNPVRSLLEEPRPAAAPVRVWRDWALLAFVTFSGVL
jgi:hypothetical protein